MVETPLNALHGSKGNWKENGNGKQGWIRGWLVNYSEASRGTKAYSKIAGIMLDDTGTWPNNEPTRTWNTCRLVTPPLLNITNRPFRCPGALMRDTRVTRTSSFRKFTTSCHPHVVHYPLLFFLCALQKACIFSKSVPSLRRQDR